MDNSVTADYSITAENPRLDSKTRKIRDSTLRRGKRSLVFVLPGYLPGVGKTRSANCEVANWKTRSEMRSGFLLVSAARHVICLLRVLL